MNNYIIYLLTYIPTGKMYVGLTSQRFEKRMNCYKNLNCKGQIKIYNAIQKYGWQNFKQEILHENLTIAEADQIEKQYIKEWKLQNDEFGYNIQDGGNSHRLTQDMIMRRVNSGYILYIVSDTETLMQWSNERKIPIRTLKARVESLLKQNPDLSIRQACEKMVELFESGYYSDGRSKKDKADKICTAKVTSVFTLMVGKLTLNKWCFENNISQFTIRRRIFNEVVKNSNLTKQQACDIVIDLHNNKFYDRLIVGNKSLLQWCKGYDCNYSTINQSILQILKYQLHLTKQQACDIAVEKQITKRNIQSSFKIINNGISYL